MKEDMGENLETKLEDVTLYNGSLLDSAYCTYG